MNSEQRLVDLTDRELGRSRRGAHDRAGNGPIAHALASPRTWAALAAFGIGVSVWDAGVGRVSLVNPAGWSLMRRFWAAALHPDLSREFLHTTGSGALATVSFAVLGTALAVVVGLIGGVLTSEVWWQRSPVSRHGRHRSTTSPGWWLARGGWGLPRGIHEAVWGLFLINIFGRDPLVGILAIAIPFGAITAKVYAELIDETTSDAFDTMRAAGAGRLTAMAYGVFPLALTDFLSYAFYRLECSIRAAVILGMIGAGGIGFQLSLSFQGLAYREMWTSIYALVLISAVADRWGSMLRRRPTRKRRNISMLVGILLIGFSTWHLKPDVARVFSGRTRRLLVDLLEQSWPLRSPSDGWWGLADRAIDTFQMSLLAIALASTLAIAVSFVAARGARTVFGRVAGWMARMVLLITRAIPPPVWALLVLFVLFPGPIPGAVALGIYNFGILGRLCAEVVENVDRRPAVALRAIGASPISVFTYATLPQSFGRFIAYSLYRWEVALRETVIVGVVGAGGLGRLLEQQRAAFDYGGMAATVLALIATSLLVDAISSTARRALR